MALPDIKVSTIGFRFRGGIAEQGQLSFYEAGRYRYGAARLLYTVEHFRNTGEVVDRLTRVVDADFRVQAPSDGSFLELVQHYATPAIQEFHQVQNALHIPFNRVFAYVLSKVIPKASGRDRLIDLAERQAHALEQFARAQQERERTQQIQAVEETERLRMAVQTIKADQIGLRDNASEAEQICTIVEKYAGTPARLAANDGTPNFIADELKAERARDKLVEEAEAELNRIDPVSEQKLIDRTRKLLPEVGLPLNRSAEQIDLEVDSRTTIAAINKIRLGQIGYVSRDDLALVISGKVVKIDNETGLGSFRPLGSRARIAFSIPKEIFSARRLEFIDTLTHRHVDLEVIPSRDAIGNIVRLLVLAVVQVGEPLER